MSPWNCGWCFILGLPKNGRGIKIRGRLRLLEWNDSVWVCCKTNHPNGMGISDVFFSIKNRLHLKIQKSKIWFDLSIDLPWSRLKIRIYKYKSESNTKLVFAMTHPKNSIQSLESVLKLCYPSWSSFLVARV